MPSKLTDERLKEAVREGYSERIKGGSCCGPQPAGAQACACGDPVTSLGYTPAQLAGLPKGAVGSSFGCGNPAAFSEVREGQVVLDVGSGAGMDCLIAARAVGLTGRVIGLDMTPAMIERARENAREAGLPNAEFRLGDADRMPVEDASVDWVISNCVINLAPDKRKVFREVARVLRPGGRIAISDIVLADDMPDLPDALKADPELYVACVAGAIRESEYLAAMREAGLTDVAVTGRIGYGEDTLRAFAEEAGRYLGGGRLEGLVGELAPVVTGKVWSARIVGRKPGGEASEAEVRVEPARADDAPVISEVLAAAGLPATAVGEHIADFLVARAGERVVGCVGLELFDKTALLRSLAVRPGARGRGVGRRLTEEILERARARGAREAVLLTTTVQEMAARAGFAPVARETVPAAVRDSWEFKADCCGTAVCMRRAL